MRTDRRRITLQLEKMESRDLPSGLNPASSLGTHDLDVRGPARALDKPAIVDHVRTDAGHVSQAAFEAGGASAIAHPLAAIPDPPFRVGDPFSVSGTNFPSNFTTKPAFKDGEQTLVVNAQRKPLLKLTISGVDDRGTKWIDLYFRSTTASLAGNQAAAWQAGPIGGIKLRKDVSLDSTFFYFTTNGAAVKQGLTSAPGILVDSNPIQRMQASVPDVFSFSNFSSGTAIGSLSLGAGVSSGIRTSYAAFLNSLHVPLTVNGLHFFFQVSTR